MGRGEFDMCCRRASERALRLRAHRRPRSPSSVPSVRYRTFLATTLPLAIACGLPRDPEGTLDRVRGGTLRVGFVVDTPWVVAAGAGAGGIEGAIAAELARGLGARIAWAHASETSLLEALHD